MVMTFVRYMLYAALAWLPSAYFLGFWLGVTTMGDNPGALLGTYMSFIFCFLGLLGIEFLVTNTGDLWAQRRNFWRGGAPIIALGFVSVGWFLLSAVATEFFVQYLFDSSIVGFSFHLLQASTFTFIAIFVFLLTAGHTALCKIDERVLNRWRVS